jgi:signal transduction histidine kinase
MVEDLRVRTQADRAGADDDHEWRLEFAAALHDSIIQRLLVAGIGLDPLVGSATPTGALAPAVRSLSILKDVIEELRSWITVLSECADPVWWSLDVNHVDLAGAVSRVIDEMILVLGFVPSFRCQPGLELAEGLVGDVVMVVREALANIARHADATSAVVSIGQRRDVLSVHISDNGRWCERPAGSGFGVVGLRRRAQRHGGSLALSTGVFGTDVMWCVPSAAAVGTGTQ